MWKWICSLMEKRAEHKAFIHVAMSDYHDAKEWLRVARKWNLRRQLPRGRQST